MTDENERILAAAEKLVALLKSPQPDLSSWAEECVRARSRIAVGNPAKEKEAYEFGFASGRAYERKHGPTD